MFKRLILAAGIVAAALSFQTTAQANGGFSLYIGSGHGFHQNHRFVDGFHGQKFHGQRFHGNRFHGHTTHASKVYKPKPVKRYNHKPRHHYKAYRLSNKQIRHHLRKRGLFNIRFVDRHHGVAKVIAHNKRGYIGKYRVSTRNGHILSGRVIRRGRHFY